MTDNTALTLLPAKVRQNVYVCLTLVSLLLTAGGALFALSPYEAPWWIGGALAGVGVLAAPFGILAANNVKPDAPVENRSNF